MVDYEQARKTMVENQLLTSAITDRRLLAAMRQIAREAFVPEAQRELAYIDRDLPLKPGRSLPAPAPFAKLVQLAEITATDRVLDLGAGTGYSTAVLAALGDTVVGVETDPDLAALARENLAAAGIANATIVGGPLETAAAGRGPFDAIVLEGLVKAVAPALTALLADGGRLVALVANDPPVAHVFVRSGDAIASRAEFNATLPVLERASHPDDFVF